MAIHPTAVIDPKAELDRSVEVGAYCVIDAHVSVAAGCRLYHGVYLTGWTEIGEDCEFHPGAIIGHVPQDAKYGGERSFCRIGRGTVVREYATVHRGTIPESETLVGEGCFLLAGSHVAHNCTLGNEVTLINNVLLAGHVEVGDRATIGGGAAIHQFVRVGELAMIQGGAGVSLDVVPFALANEFGAVAGLNIVGLRRAGIPREHIQDLRGAYKILFRSGLTFRKAVEKFTCQVSSPPGERLLRFLQGPSHRGFAGRRTNRSPRKGGSRED